MASLKSRWVYLSLYLLIIIGLSSCGISSTNASRGTYPVDATFADFYRQFGGESILGPAISPSFDKEGKTYQYIVTGLMAYDPNQVPLKRFYFSPIASVEWHISGLIEPRPQDAEVPYVNGHQIWDEILSFYQQYGPDILGLPVTGVKVNDAKQRYEQYFEGVGFYRNYTDPAGQVHLMPYGSWMCGVTCQYSQPDTNPPSASYPRDYSATEQLFLQASERLGYGFSGAPIATPGIGSDGNYEMAFENVIMYLDPTNTNQIKLRPLPSWLGIQVDKPLPVVQQEGFTFFEVGEGSGFNIPDLVNHYIEKHGGYEVSGNPISNWQNLNDGGYSQCFTNLCLEYHPTAPLSLQVRPHALGTEFLSLGSKASPSGTAFPEALQINAWEDQPLIPSGQSQVIHIEARQNNTPMRGIQFSLVVRQPDGITKTYNLEPTDTDGVTHAELDPINGPNGAIVQYEVCVIGTISPGVCFSRSYTIWDQP
jgi:hypothetical protein